MEEKTKNHIVTILDSYNTNSVEVAKTSLYTPHSNGPITVTKKKAMANLRYRDSIWPALGPHF